MRVKCEKGKTCDGRLRAVITERCGTVNRFARKVGLSESMMSHILHGRRKVYPWNEELFAVALGMDTRQLDTYLGG